MLLTKTDDNTLSLAKIFRTLIDFPKTNAVAFNNCSKLA